MIRNCVVLAVLAVMFAGCSYQSSRQQVNCDSKELVSSQLLNEAGFELEWQNELPLKPFETVARVFVAGDYVYAFSDHNLLMCLDRFSGKLRFVRQFTWSGLPIEGPTEYAGMLYFSVGKEIVRLDPETGEVKTEMTLPAPAVTPVGFTKDYMYVAMGNGWLTSYRNDNQAVNYKISSENFEPIIGLDLNERVLFFTTEVGAVVAVSATEPTRFWSFDLGGKVKADFIYDGDSLYLPCVDSILYKLDVKAGELQWKVSLGASLVQDPSKGDSVVYVPADEKGLYGIDAESGEILWQVHNGTKFVAENDDLAYIFTSDRLLSVMDNSNGQNVHKINFGAVNDCASNTLDSRMYVTDSHGKLACIKPAK